MTTLAELAEYLAKHDLQAMAAFSPHNQRWEVSLRRAYTQRPLVHCGVGLTISEAAMDAIGLFERIRREG